MALPPMSPPTSSAHHAHRHHHPRRPSNRRSSTSSTSSNRSLNRNTSLSNLNGNSSSPTRMFSKSSLGVHTPSNVDRTPCPRDGDAFSYDPKHLGEWFIPDDLWRQLPEQLQLSLAAVQHAGAAALTGFERLEKLSEEMKDNNIPVAEVRTPLAGAKTRSGRIDSFTGSDHEESIPDIQLDTPETPSSMTSSSLSPLGSPLSQVPTNPLDALPASLLPLGNDPNERKLASRTARSDTPSLRSRHPSTDRHHHRQLSNTFSDPATPRDPYTSRYFAELSHLRSVSIVRLRHKARGVDMEMVDARRSAIDKKAFEDFETWWQQKRKYITMLDSEGAAIERQQLAIEEAAELSEGKTFTTGEDGFLAPLAKPITV